MQMTYLLLVPDDDVTELPGMAFLLGETLKMLSSKFTVKKCNFKANELY